MIRLIAICALLSCSCEHAIPTFPLPPSSIRFEPISLEGALQRAARERKLVFLEIHAPAGSDWRRLHKEAFSDASLGIHFSRYYISLKIDAYTAQGNVINKRYSISDYPTLLFLNEEGHILQRAVGVQNAQELLRLSENLIARFGRDYHLPPLE